MIKYEIREFIKKYPRTYSQRLNNKYNKELLDKILRITYFLDLHNDLNIDIWLSTRCWFILNNITEPQQLHKCGNCGKFLVKNHFLNDKINNSLQFCNISCKKLYYNNKKQKKYQQYVNSLTELNIKYWELQGFSYNEAVMKVREYKPYYKEYWIAKGYSEEEAKQKANNVENPIKLEYWIAKGYSEEEAIKQIDNEKNNRLKNIPKNKEYWIAKGYSEEEAIKQAKYEYCIKNPTTVEYWIEKGYSEEEARYEIRKKKKISKEYWIAKGYSEEEAIKQAKYEASIRNQSNKEYWIAKGYSEEEAIKQAKCHGNHFDAAHALFTKKQNRFCKEYWIAKGYSEEEAIKQAKLTNKNTTKNISHEVRVDAYKRGRKNITDEDRKKTALKISKKLKNKNKTHSPIFKEYWIAKGYSEEEAKKQVSITKFSSDGNLIKASKIETYFFNELELYLKTIKFIRQKWVRINEKNYCQDGRYNNIVIEFNGTYFHMDERFYSSNDFNPFGVKFDDVKQRDKNKIDAYLFKQYNIIVVWEYDYINHKDELFSKIKEIIKNEKSYKTGSYWNSASVFNKC